MAKSAQMSNKEYRTKEGISASDLKKMVKSMATWKYEQDNPADNDSAALLFGRAYHKLMLEPDDFDNEFKVIPAFNCSTKEGKLAYASYVEELIGRELTDDEKKYKDSITAVLMNNTPNVDFISREDKDKLIEMQKALYATPFVKLLIEGEHEKSFFWTDKASGVKCKCRPDSYGMVKDQCICVDLKTTNNAETNAFMRDALKFNYDIQAAHYCEGLENILKKPFKFIFIAQEKTAPYLVNVLEADDYFVRNGAEIRKMLLDKYKTCVKTNKWPGYMDENSKINSLSVPAWIKDSLDMDDEEVIE